MTYRAEEACQAESDNQIEASGWATLNQCIRIYPAVKYQMSLISLNMRF